MSFTLKTFSKVKLLDRFKDIIIDYIDENHVRIMKLFPFCKEKKPPTQSSYKRFHLRFYIPKSIYNDKFHKIRKCFIYLNGLDEIRYFTLYDQLGKALCNFGYASILIPLPNHLNRNLGFRVGDLKRLETPSESFLTEPEKIYLAYKQFIKEIDILYSHICNKKCHKPKSECCAFYKYFFDDNVRVSIIGYSLGGLGALSYYLLRKHKINSCILLNSGAQLDDIDVSDFIPIDKWQQMIIKLHKEKFLMKNDLSEQLFDRLFLGNSLTLLKNDLKEESRKILFILGGSDSVTRRQGISKIEPENYGLSILQLPGIHHFLSIDLHWDQWFSSVINMIVSFEENASREPLHPNDILDTLIKYQLKYNFIKKIDHYDSNFISDEHERLEIKRTLFTAEAIFGTVELAIIEMFLLLERSRRRPELYPANYKLLLSSLIGTKAIEKQQVNSHDITQALLVQKDELIKKKPCRKLGKILLDNGKLTHDF